MSTRHCTPSVNPSALDPREQRGIRIAGKPGLCRDGQLWIVPSESSATRYKVSPESGRCTCPDNEVRHVKCKHLWAVEYTIRQETTRKEQTTITEGGTSKTVTTTVKTVKRVTYRQSWPAYNEAQSQEKARFALLLRDLCATVEQPEQTNGRPRLPLADMLFAATFKVYSGFSSRRFTTDLREMQGQGLIDRAPHFNSVSNYLADPALTPILKTLIERSAAPLRSVEVDFAIDSTGFATSTYARWFDHKWGKERTRQTWVKTHLMCGVKTNIVTAAEATPFESGDAPQLPALLATTAQTFNVQEVSADKAYASRSNHVAIAAVGASAFIPMHDTHSGAVSHKAGRDRAADSVWNRAWHFYNFNRETFFAHYHKRSNVETVMHMVKSKFGGSVRSKSPHGQVNEVLCKVLAHNICVLIASFYELGIEAQFCTESLMAAQKAPA